MAEPKDIDPQETREWVDALHSALESEGVERAHELVEKLIDELRRSGAHLPYKATTAYLNTIRKSDEARMPGEPGLAVKANPAQVKRTADLTRVRVESDTDPKISHASGSFARQAPPRRARDPPQS